MMMLRRFRSECDLIRLINIGLVLIIAAAVYFMPEVADFVVKFYFLFGVIQIVYNNFGAEPESLFNWGFHPLVFLYVLLYKLIYAEIYAYVTNTQFDAFYFVILGLAFTGQLGVMFAQSRYPDMVLLNRVCRRRKVVKPDDLSSKEEQLT